MIFLLAILICMTAASRVLYQMFKQQSRDLQFRSPRLDNKEVTSSQFSFNIESDKLDYSYFTVTDKVCRVDWTGSYSGLLGDRGVKQGVQHYKIKIKKSLERHQLIGYISVEEKNQKKPWSEFLSRNFLYSEDGTTRTKGTTRFIKRAIKEGDILQCICDIPNGIISWTVDEKNQVIAQAHILPQFREKEMIPYIGLEDIGDMVEILA